jgi:hypothetical protein
MQEAIPTVTTLLCELASKEEDPEKLIDLIGKINQALEEDQQKLTTT